MIRNTSQYQVYNIFCRLIYTFYVLDSLLLEMIIDTRCRVGQGRNTGKYEEIEVNVKDTTYPEVHLYGLNSLEEFN